MDKPPYHVHGLKKDASLTDKSQPAYRLKVTPTQFSKLLIIDQDYHTPSIEM